MKPTKDEIIKGLRKEITIFDESLQAVRSDYHKQKDRADSYRKMATEILVAMGEHGQNLDMKWIGRKLGEMLK